MTLTILYCVGQGLRFGTAVILLCGVVGDAFAQRTEIGLTKTSSSAVAFNVISIDGCGGSGCYQGGAGENDDDVETATANALFPNGVSGFATDPSSDAACQALTTAFAGVGTENETKTAHYAILSAQNQPTAFGKATLHESSADATAQWTVEGEGWIESQI